MRKPKVCVLLGCEAKVRARGYCGKHYQRLMNYGDPLYLPPRKPRRPVPLAERFWAKVEKTDTCWLWIGKRDRGGYGRFVRAEGSELAHRIAYELVVGPIPSGLTLDHLCRTPRCVNPEHLEPVTLSENVRRMLAATNRAYKTHCVNGHQFTPDNTKIRSGGRRKCRACDREQAMTRYYKRKGLVA